MNAETRQARLERLARSLAIAAEEISPPPRARPGAPVARPWRRLAALAGAPKAVLVPLVALALLLAGGLAAAALTLPYTGRVLPGVRVGDVDLGGLTAAEARLQLTGALMAAGPSRVILSGPGRNWTIPRQDLTDSEAVDSLVDRALASGRQSWPQQVLAAVLARLGRVVIEPVPSAQVSAYVSDQISRDVDRAPVDATVTVASGTPQITGGTAGLYLLRHSLAGCLSQAMAARAPRPFAIGTVTVPPAISEEDLEPTLTQVHQLIDAPVTLRFAGLDVRLQAADLGRLIRVAGPAPRPGPVDVQSAPVVAAVDEASLNDYVTHTLGPEVDQPPRDATFIANGDSVQVVPSADGRQVDQAQLAQRLESALEGGPRTVDIPTEVAHPAFTTEQAQALGISARIASGVSHFAGSSPERKNNVRVAAAHINGAVIKPGDTFSFNSEVGDISLATGFLEGLIISGGRTVPGVGGGVCQVSTTVFRAALNAGLPIVERHAHAYRVGWYEQGGFPPGLDATVFTGVDLRFRNDSDAAMVLMTEYDPAGTLTVTLWGSHALNRAVTLSDPAISNVTPHPEDEYVLDSSLAPGTTQQVDYAHDGMDVSFTRSVSQGGQPLFSDTFSSHYQAWRNIFLYNPASPSPATQSPAPSPGQ